MSVEERTSIGQIKEISVETTVPPMQVKNMTLNKLVLLVGANGTGKSFILTLNWVISNFLVLYFELKDKSYEFLKESFQALIDYSFDLKDITGTIKADFDKVSLEFTLNEGTIKDFRVINLSGKDNLQGTRAIYLSSRMRLLSSLLGYFKTVKLLNPEGLIDDDSIKRVFSLYKNFDIQYAELLKAALQKGVKPNSEVMEKINEMFSRSQHDEITELEWVEEPLDILYVTKGGEKKSVETLGNGEQAVLNMFYGTDIINKHN